MLAWLTKLLESTDTPIGNVVHIGAGVGAELAVYHDLNCEQVLAIEPDITLFKKLKSKAKRFDNVSVQQTWVADSVVERNASVFSNPRFNSLLPADKLLLEHFPNVKNTETLRVRTESFTDLVTNSVKRVDGKLNLLVLDVQGFETMLFKNTPASVLQLFSWIVIRTSEVALFEDGANTTDIKGSLIGPGFELRLSETEHLPFVEQYYQLNTSVIELNTVKPEIQALESQITSQKQQLDETTKNLTKKKAIVRQLEENVAKSVEQYTAAQASIDELQKKISRESEITQQNHQEKTKQIESLNVKTSELKEQMLKAQTEAENAVVKNSELSEKIASMKKLEQEKNEQSKSLATKLGEANQLVIHKKELVEEVKGKLTRSIEHYTAAQAEVGIVAAKNTELSQQVEDFKQVEQQKSNQIDSLKVEVDELTSELKAFKKTLEESQQNVKEQTQWHHKNKEWAEGLNKKVQSLDAELNKANEQQKAVFQTLSLNTKLMTKLEIDNEGLRTKLSVKTNEEKQLKELIRELHEKLKLASAFYHQVQQNYPDLLDSES